MALPSSLAMDLVRVAWAGHGLAAASVLAPDLAMLALLVASAAARPWGPAVALGPVGEME